MAGTAKRKVVHVSSDSTMAKWPQNIDPRVDKISPYPCCSCKHTFYSCKALATHKCEPGNPVKPPRVHS